MARTRRTPSRRTLAIAAAVTAVIGLGGAGIGLARTGDGDHPSAGAPIAVGSARVTRADLSDSVALSGSLGFGPPRTFRGSGKGIVTWLPPAGTTVGRGRELYRADDHAVVVFFGTTPLFRTLDTEGMVGRDVKVVADNLRALGYDTGTQPAIGSVITPRPAQNRDEDSSSGEKDTSSGGKDTASGEKDAASGEKDTAEAPSTDPSTGPSGDSVGDPSGMPVSTASPAAVRVERGDAVLTSGLIAAVKRWQRDRGLPATGVLSDADVAVTGSAVRVAALSAQVGGDSGEDLMTLTGTRKCVTVKVEENLTSSLQRGRPVRVTLADGTAAAGRISGISTSVQDGGAAEDGDSEPQRTVTVLLDDASALRGTDSAPVQVEFPGRTRKGVLVVPLGALVALREGGYAVQKPRGGLVAVTTGLFAKGMVEVSGSGLTAGMAVVTTS
ncbi:peptidoglycan-binding protein [Streptomyces sp. NPDC091281]|uniref:peptidoglycan-binding protein n=1 Tax=Streptomyces sp. NPDC091281 TaxID=3365985 RepID=UPI00382D03C4